MFLKLKDNFRPIAHDDYFELFDNTTITEYRLDEQQYDLLLSINGTKSQEEILSDYDETSKPIVKTFLVELESIGALKKLEKTHPRNFPLNQPTPYLEAILWDITSLCNLECAHCYVSEYYNEARGSDLSTDEVYAVIDEMESMNVRDVSLTGGEPFMRKDIQKIIKLVYNDTKSVEHWLLMSKILPNISQNWFFVVPRGLTKNPF
jgi:sulfatase maturation enzyme AslB (radical SAM superfamily)